jgi:PD-(D/E)XK endonuclease
MTDKPRGTESDEEGITTAMCGRAGEEFARAMLRCRGFTLLRPDAGAKGYDVAVERGGQLRRIQVKARAACDGNNVNVKDAALDHFDYFVIVMLNVGRFYGTGVRGRETAAMPTLYVLPVAEVRRRMKGEGPRGARIDLRETLRDETTGKKVRVRAEWLTAFENFAGLDLIARDLRLPDPVPSRLRRDGLWAESGAAARSRPTRPTSVKSLASS